MTGRGVEGQGRYEKLVRHQTLQAVANSGKLWLTIHDKSDNSASLEALALTTSTIHSAA